MSSVLYETQHKSFFKADGELCASAGNLAAVDSLYDALFTNLYGVIRNEQDGIKSKTRT
jgi:hypothetical protein